MRVMIAAAMLWLSGAANAADLPSVIEALKDEPAESGVLGKRLTPLFPGLGKALQSGAEILPEPYKSEEFFIWDAMEWAKGQPPILTVACAAYSQKLVEALYENPMLGLQENGIPTYAGWLDRPMQAGYHKRLSCTFSIGPAPGAFFDAEQSVRAMQKLGEFSNFSAGQDPSQMLQQGKPIWVASEGVLANDTWFQLLFRNSEEVQELIIHMEYPEPLG